MSPARRDLPLGEGERQAELARQTLKLGLDAPISVMNAVEDLAGVPVCVAEFDKAVAGIFYKRAGQPFLFVNGAHPLVRQRFTLAHEYGHVFMDHKARVETTAAMNLKDPQEVQANDFAGGFLAPRQAVRNWAERHQDLAADLELVVRMSVYFGISAQAGCIRLEKAGVISEHEARALKRFIKAGQHHGLPQMLGLTPFPDEFSRLMRDVLDGTRSLPRVPSQLVRNARRAHQRGFLDDEELKDVLRGVPDISVGPDRGFDED